MPASNPFFDFFNRDRPHIDSDTTKWPAAWKTIRWKSYPRSPGTTLPDPKANDIPLRTAILNRKSSREFSSKPLTTQEISTLLFYSCGLTRPHENKNQSRRAQPSGGGLYPIETYLLVFRGTAEIKSGTYHYNVLDHTLEKLGYNDVANLKTAFHYPWVADTSLMLLFSFLEERTKPKYGNFAYKVGLIEAGHIGQNVYLNCAAMKLKCSALGGMDFEKMHRFFDLNQNREVLFYSIAVGK